MSQVVFSEDNFTLTCIANLSSNSKVLVNWRFNNQDVGGSDFSSSRSYYTITSSLHRHNASLHDSGYYECLILDGLDPKDQNSAMITVSEKAYVRVLGE